LLSRPTHDRFQQSGRTPLFGPPELQRSFWPSLPLFPAPEAYGLVVASRTACAVERRAIEG